MSEQMIPCLSGSDVVFIGWQKARWGKVFALYKITAEGHASYGSTVTDTDLHKLHLQIPSTPHPPSGMNTLKSSVRQLT